ncbi:MAG: fibronectin type III domain-containing protein [Spirochaetales bacterium]|nr:fibronectin type III domain-containing protein [Spirochaetales bacterium]
MQKYIAFGVILVSLVTAYGCQNQLLSYLHTFYMHVDGEVLRPPELDAFHRAQANLTLITHLHGLPVEWELHKNDAVKKDGSLKRPAYGEEQISGVVTAKVTVPSERIYHFPFLVKVDAKDAVHALEEERDALEIHFSSGDSEDRVQSRLGFPETSFLYGAQITWDASSHPSINNDGTLESREHPWWDVSASSVRGTVTATLVLEDEMITKDFSLVVIPPHPQPPVVENFNSPYAQFAHRFLVFPTLPGAPAIMHYQIEHRRQEFGVWTEWTTDPPSSYSSIGDTQSRFGWTQAQLPRGTYQFRVRVIRNEIVGEWATTGIYENF